MWWRCTSPLFGASSRPAVGPGCCTRCVGAVTGSGSRDRTAGDRTAGDRTSLMIGRGLRAGSVRTRVALGVIAGLAVVLALLCVAVNAIFVAQSERNLDALLAGRVQLGRQLARAGVGPQQIVNRVSTNNVSAELELTNGMLYTAGSTSGDVRSASATLNGGVRVDGAQLTVSV